MTDLCKEIRSRLVTELSQRLMAMIIQVQTALRTKYRFVLLMRNMAYLSRFSTPCVTSYYDDLEASCSMDDLVFVLTNWKIFLILSEFCKFVKLKNK